jgi:hypothetical protein
MLIMQKSKQQRKISETQLGGIKTYQKMRNYGKKTIKVKNKNQE